jgi:hypothetical protein
VFTTEGRVVASDSRAPGTGEDDVFCGVAFVKGDRGFEE